MMHTIHNNINIIIFFFASSVAFLIASGTSFTDTGLSTNIYYNYKMASVIWRWNHPDNPKPQVQTRGYPNQQLHQDVMMFYFNLGNKFD